MKFMDIVVRVVAVFIGIVLILVISKWVWGYVFGTSADNNRPAAPITDTRGAVDSRAADIQRSNPKKEKWLQDCAAQNAPVTQRGGGILDCNRSSRIETYVDGERVE